MSETLGRITILSVKTECQRTERTAAAAAVGCLFSCLAVRENTIRKKQVRFGVTTRVGEFRKTIFRVRFPSETAGTCFSIYGPLFELDPRGCGDE